MLSFTSSVAVVASLLFALAVAQQGNNDAGRQRRCVAAIPGGAPPTNDGYAYSNVCWNDDVVCIAGQNGYDSCGNLAPVDYDGDLTPHIYTRGYMTMLNVQSILQCFNMDFNQMFEGDLTISTAPLAPNGVANSSTFIRLRGEFNRIQRLPEYYGDNGLIYTREIRDAGLSRGDTVELRPGCVPRINRNQRTCIDTQVPPPAAVKLLAWTVNGTLPTTAVPLARIGSGPCPAAARK